MDEPKRQTCTHCDARIREGQNAIRRDEGVIGTQGFIELEETIFCSDSCLGEYLNDRQKKIYKLKRRVP